MDGSEGTPVKSSPDPKISKDAARKNADKLLKKMRKSRRSQSPKTTGKKKSTGAEAVHAPSPLGDRNVAMPAPAPESIDGSPEVPAFGATPHGQIPITAPSTSPTERQQPQAGDVPKTSVLRSPPELPPTPDTAVSRLRLGSESGPPPTMATPTTTPTATPGPATAGPASTSRRSTPRSGSRSPADLRKLRAKFAKKGSRIRRSRSPNSLGASPLTGGPVAGAQSTPHQPTQRPPRVPAKPDPRPGTSAALELGSQESGPNALPTPPHATSGGSAADSIDSELMESYTKRMSAMITEREADILDAVGTLAVVGEGGEGDDDGYLAVGDAESLTEERRPESPIEVAARAAGLEQELAFARERLAQSRDRVVEVEEKAAEAALAHRNELDRRETLAARKAEETRQLESEMASLRDLISARRSEEETTAQAELNDINDKLRGELTTMRSELRTVKEHAQELMAANATLANEVDTKEADVRHLEAELDGISRRDKELEALAENVETLQAQKESAEAALAKALDDAKVRVEAAVQAGREAQAGLAERSVELQNLAGDLMAKETQITALSDEASVAKAEAAALKEELNRTRRDCGLLKDENAQMSIDFETKKAEVVSLTSRINDITASSEAELADGRSTISGLNARIAHLEASSGPGAAESSRQIAALQAQLKELQDTAAVEAEAAVKDKESAVSELQAIISGLEVAAIDKDGTVERLSARIEELESGPDAVLATLQEQLSEKAREVDELRTLNAGLTDTVQNRGDEVVRLQLELETQCAQAAVQVAKLVKSKEILEASSDTMAETLEVVQAENKNLHNREIQTVAAFQAQIKEFEASTEITMREAATQHSAVVSDLNARVTELQGTIAHKDDTIESLTARVAELNITSHGSPEGAMTSTPKPPQGMRSADPLSPAPALPGAADGPPSPEVQKLLHRALDTRDADVIQRLGEVAVQLAQDYEKAKESVVAFKSRPNVGDDLRGQLQAQEDEMEQLRQELIRSEEACDRLIGVRESQESILSDRDGEIAELSTSMHAGLTEGEGSEMQQRAEKVRNAREIVEAQRQRMAKLHNAQLEVAESAARYRVQVESLSTEVNRLEARVTELTTASDAAKTQEAALDKTVKSLECRLAEADAVAYTQSEATAQAEARVAAAEAEAATVATRVRNSEMQTAEALAQAATLERRLVDATDAAAREGAEAAAREASVRDALAVAEKRVAALESQRRESSPAVAAKVAELERVQADLNTANDAKARLEQIESNLSLALKETKDALLAAEEARDAAVAKGEEDLLELKTSIVTTRDDLAEATAETEMLRTLLEDQAFELQRFKDRDIQQTAEFNERVGWLEGQLQTAAAESNDAHRKIGELRSRTDAANETIAERDAHVLNLETELTTVQADLAAKQEAAATFETRATRAEADLERKEQELLSVKDKYDSLAAAYESAEKRLSGDDGERREMSAKNVALETRVASLDQLLSDKKEELEVAEAQVKQAREDVDYANSERDAEFAAREEAEAAEITIRKELERLQSQRSKEQDLSEQEHGNEEARLQSEVDRLRDQQDDDLKRFEQALEKQKHAFEHKMSAQAVEHGQDIAKLHATIAEGEVSLDDLKKKTADLGDEVQKGELELQRVQMAKAAREAELIERLEQSTAAADVLRSEMKELLERTDQQTLQMREINAAYEVARTEYEDRIRGLKSEIAEMNDHISETVSAGELAMSRAKAAEGQLSSLRDLVAAGQAQRAAADNAIETIKSDLADEKQRGNEVEAKLATAEAKVSELEVTIAESKQIHSVEVAELERLRASQAAQRVELEHLRVEVEQLREAKEELTTAYEEMQVTLGRLKADYSAASAAKVRAEQVRDDALAEAKKLQEANAAFTEENAAVKTELAHSVDQVERLHDSVGALVAERDRFMTEAVDSEAKRVHIEQEMFRLRSVYMWHTAYGAKTKTRGGPALVQRADTLERQLATALAEKTRIEGKLAASTAAAATEEKRHRKLRAGYMWHHLSWRARKQADDVATARRTASAHRQELDALEAKLQDAEVELAAQQRHAESRAEATRRLEAEVNDAAARVRTLEFEKGQLANELTLEKVRLMAHQTERQSSEVVDQAVRNLNGVVGELSGELAECKSHLEQLKVDKDSLILDKVGLAERVVRLEATDPGRSPVPATVPHKSTYEQATIESRSALLEADNKRLHAELANVRREARSVSPAGTPGSAIAAAATPSTGLSQNKKPSPLRWDETPKGSIESHALRAAMDSPHMSSSRAHHDTRRAAFLREVAAWGDMPPVEHLPPINVGAEQDSPPSSGAETSQSEASSPEMDL